ncbi:MAG: hypothetical protein R3B60_03815 [Candidatus Paceibacterota bacterium]
MKSVKFYVVLIILIVILFNINSWLQSKVSSVNANSFEPLEFSWEKEIE